MQPELARLVMRAPWLALLAALAACDTCTSAQAPPDDAGVPDRPAPEPWTMGAASDAALPPPCQPRAEALRAVLVREARVATARGVLDEVFTAEGATPHGPARWRHDAAGLMRPQHGRGEVVGVPWPEQGPPRYARSARHWLGLVDRRDGSWLWHAPRAGPGDATLERLGPYPALSGADVACADDACALLTSRVDPAGIPMAPGSGATLWLGSVDEAVASWQRIDLRPPDEQAAPFRIVALASGETARALVVLVDALRVRFVWAARDGSVAAAAALSAPHGALDAVALESPDGPRPAALIHNAAPGTRCGEPDVGGAGVVIADAAPTLLRSATPASEAVLVAIPDGVLALWLAPARCDAPQLLLFAAVLRGDGTAIAPVTTVGQADGFAIAALGGDVDLWIRRDTGGQAHTVTWLRARCALDAAP